MKGIGERQRITAASARFVTRVWPLAVVLTACTSQPELPAAMEEEEAPTIAVTHWTDRSELFMEYPPLAVGATGRFAVHLTDLATFRPLVDGRVDVVLEGADTFSTDGPSSPGIFGLDVTPSAAGTYTMRIVLESSGIRDTHDLGPVTVYPDLNAALAAMPPEAQEERVSFLKEQQWNLDFATALVEARALAGSFVVPAEVHPRIGGEVEVRSTTAGRVAMGSGRPVGTLVREGEVLVELISRNDRVGERPVLELELVDAQARLRLATTDLDRVTRLADVGAVPQRRLEESRLEQETAETRVMMLQEELRHLELTRTGEGTGSADERVLARAPLSGIVAETQVTPGAVVDAGQLLFRLVAVDRVYVVGAVPEADVGRLAAVETAEVEVPGLASQVAASRLVSVGRVVDHGTRTVPITFEIRNPPPAMAVGQAVSLRLFTAPEAPGPVMPVAAIVDDGGQPVVFVQTGGESFERRPVRLGTRQGGLVQVLDGVNENDRVVSEGAHLIRLAALSPQTPAHGHVH